jgi:hypothetical protein
MTKWTCAALLAGVLAVVGCGPQPAATTGGGKAGKTPPPTDPSDEDGGEWCNPHGILEDECSMCLPKGKVQTMFKDKGDWCDTHNRAKSQCFICDPSLMEKAKADYKARYGKEMPTPKGNMPVNK